MIIALSIFAWIGAGMFLMFVVAPLKYNEKAFLRFVSKVLRCIFFVSWFLYRDIQFRSKRDNELATNWRIRTFPLVHNILPKDIIGEKDYRVYVRGASHLLATVKETAVSDENLYFAVKLFQHMKGTPEYDYITAADSYLCYLHCYELPESISDKALHSLLQAFASMQHLKGYWGYIIFEQWFSDVLLYGDRHYGTTIRKILD